MSGLHYANVPPTPAASTAAGAGGGNPVTPTAAAAAAAAAALTGGSSDPASAGAAKGAPPPVEKVRRYVSASCGRCGYHLSNWTVRTPARRAPLPNASGEKQNPESSPSSGGGGGATVVRASTPTPGSSPASLTRCASEPPGAVVPGVGGEEQQQLGPLLEPDPSDLFPSHVKSTYLGPEHVQLFPNVEGARNFLGRAVLLDPKQAKHAGDTWPDDSDGEKTNCDDEESEKNGPKGRGGGGVNGGGKGQRPSDRVTQALICPRCSFMLASSPTSSWLGLKGRFVVYQPSLRLSSTTDVPSPCTEPNSPTQPLGPSDFGALKPSHHDALPLIYDREEFEEVLLRSALAPSTSSRAECFRKQLDRKSSYSLRRSSDGYGEMLNDAYGKEDGVVNSGEEGEGDSNDDDEVEEDDDIYGTTNPAELVILAVGQFWCPFSVSAVTRLSDYRRRQGMIMQNKNSGGGGIKPNRALVGGGLGGDGGTGGEAGSLTRGVGAAAEGRRGAPTDLAGLGYRQGISSSPGESNSNQPPPSMGPNANSDSNSNPNSTLKSSGNSKNSTGGDKQRPHSHRRTASVPVTPNIFPSNTARKPHHKVTKSSSGIENDEAASNSNHNAMLRSPCTFLLLDSFYHGESGGGVDPSQVLRPDLANDVKELPIPCFLVWYRGCRVNVTNASQHFRCLKGAVIGLDLARYVDIVVPRIAAEARAAFGRCGVSAASDVKAREDTRTKLGGAGLGGLGGLLEGAKSNDVIWADVGDVPDLDDRPILDIKL